MTISKKMSAAPYLGKIVSDIRRGHPIAGHARGIRE